MKEKKVYLVTSLPRIKVKRELDKARNYLGEGTWKNITFVTITHPLWVEDTKEKAIKTCREYNNEYKADTHFYIELYEY